MSQAENDRRTATARRRAAQAAALVDLCRQPEQPTVTVALAVHNAERPVLAYAGTLVCANRLARRAERDGQASAAYEAAQVAHDAAGHLEVAYDGMVAVADQAEPLRAAKGAK